LNVDNVKSVTSKISFDVRISDEEIKAIEKMLSGNKVRFKVLEDAQLVVSIRVDVKRKP